MGQKSTFTDVMKLEARQMFVEGFEKDGKRTYPSLAELVDHFKVSKATLYRRAKEENWQAQKNRFQSEYQAKRDADRLGALVREGQKLDSNSLQIAQAMLSKVGRRLHQAMQREADNPRVTDMTASELRELSHVTANAQKIGKLALGEAQEISKVSADVNAPESFQRLMEQLDEVAAGLSSEHSHTIQ